MIKHIWTVLCRESLIDSETNNITLINVFEKLEVNVSLPSKTDATVHIPITYELVTFWAKTDSEKAEEADVKILIISPSGEVLKEVSRKLTIPLNIKRTRARLKISGLKIIESGDYVFRVTLREKDKKRYITVAEVPLQVEVQRKAKKKVN